MSLSSFGGSIDLKLGVVGLMSESVWKPYIAYALYIMTPVNAYVPSTYLFLTYVKVQDYRGICLTVEFGVVVIVYEICLSRCSSGVCMAVRLRFERFLCLLSFCKFEVDEALRVQVPNNHILTQNQYYTYYYPKPKNLIIGYMDPINLNLMYPYIPLYIPIYP